jgi:hypothetical protein
MNELPGFKAWAKGDVFVGSTVLGNREDDHAGRGRILQYDSNLTPKGAMWIDETTHLIGGLKFDRQGQLWAFDSQAFVVLTVDRNGTVERRRFGNRPFSHANFARDGSILLGEHVMGSLVKPEIAARMGTRIPFMPGTDRMGDGHVWRFRRDGTLVKEYATHTHGGIGGFLGVTMSALTPDESVLVYCSETGPRLMRYDLRNDRQLPDLQSYPEGQREMFFALKYWTDGKLCALRGTRIDVVDDSGVTVRSYPLEGFGWATLELSYDGKFAYVGNFFTGELAKIDLGSGAEVASVHTGVAKSLAGIAQYVGAVPPERTSRQKREVAGPGKRKSATARKRSQATRKRRSTASQPARRKQATRKDARKRKPGVKRKAGVKRKHASKRQRSAARRGPSRTGRRR